MLMLISLVTILMMNNYEAFSNDTQAETLYSMIN